MLLPRRKFHDRSHDAARPQNRWLSPESCHAPKTKPRRFACSQLSRANLPSRTAHCPWDVYHNRARVPGFTARALGKIQIRGVESRSACAPQACLAALVAAIAEQRAAAGSAGAPSLLFEASEVCPVPQRARACRQAARFHQTTITNAECKAQW